MSTTTLNSIRTNEPREISEAEWAKQDADFNRALQHNRKINSTQINIESDQQNSKNSIFNTLKKHHIIFLGALAGAVVTALATNIIFGSVATILGFLIGGILGGGIGFYTDRKLSLNIYYKE